MFSFIIGVYVGGAIVEAATEFVSVPGARMRDIAFTGAVWPYTIGRYIVRAFR